MLKHSKKICVLLFLYSFTAVASESDSTTQIFTFITDSISNLVVQTKKSFEQLTGKDENKKLKKAIIDLGFEKDASTMLVREVEGSYRYFPQLANYLVNNNAEVYSVSFKQFINNEEETRRDFSECTLIIIDSVESIDYSLSDCKISTKNFSQGEIASDEKLISQDNDEKIMETLQIKVLKKSIKK